MIDKYIFFLSFLEVFRGTIAKIDNYHETTRGQVVIVTYRANMDNC